ncbi:MAG: cytochrome c oxidase assembly protein [Methylophilaceae bacterium]
MSEDVSKNTLNKRLAWKLALLAIGALFFGFALAPLYSVLCKSIGLNGRADSSATLAAKTLKIDNSREVEVLFTGNTMPGLTWSFHSNDTSIMVHPGEIKLTSYFARNDGNEAVMGVAVPSITPEVAALYFKKIECFCFKQQTLKAGESKEMPVRFYVSPDLPKDIKEVTLSYAFYSSTQASAAKENTTKVN